jgi:hypothetical protein
VSPILTRPVREQLEHDRIIRQLQARYKRKHEVVINPGNEQNQSVTVGQLAVFPDLLLFTQEQRGRKLQGTVEVETGESVNQLEALAEWGVFTKLKVPLHLYVPSASLDAARRLCSEHQIEIGELWTFSVALDQVRFTMIHRSAELPVPKVKAAPAPPPKRPAKPAPKARAKAARPAAKKVAAKPAAKKSAVSNKKSAVSKKKPAAKKSSKPVSKRR